MAMKIVYFDLPGWVGVAICLRISLSLRGDILHLNIKKKKKNNKIICKMTIAMLTQIINR